MRWWTVLKAGRKYTEAALADGWASARTQRDRAAVCGSCPYLTRRAVGKKGVAQVIASGLGIPHAGAALGFCGTALKETDKTCGCLVLAESEGDGSHVILTIDGDDVPMVAAGKTTITGEQCPQGKW
jgi:hypothetical protein